MFGCDAQSLCGGGVGDLVAIVVAGGHLVSKWTLECLGDLCLDHHGISTYTTQILGA